MAAVSLGDTLALLDHLTATVDPLDPPALDILQDSHLTMDLGWDLGHKWCLCLKDRDLECHLVEPRDLLVPHLRAPNLQRRRKDWQTRYCLRK